RPAEWAGSKKVRSARTAGGPDPLLARRLPLFFFLSRRLPRHERLARPRHARRRGGPSRLVVEPFEQRQAPAVYWVTNTGDDAFPGAGTLRQAILDANADPFITP